MAKPRVRIDVNKLWSDAEAYTNSSRTNVVVNWNNEVPGLIDALNDLRGISKGSFQFLIGEGPPVDNIITTNLPFHDKDLLLPYPNAQQGLSIRFKQGNIGLCKGVDNKPFEKWNAHKDLDCLIYVLAARIQSTRPHYLAGIDLSPRAKLKRLSF